MELSAPDSSHHPYQYCLPPTAYRLPPTTYCLLPTAYCLLPTAYYAHEFTQLFLWRAGHLNRGYCRPADHAGERRAAGRPAAGRGLDLAALLPDRRQLCPPVQRGPCVLGRNGRPDDHTGQPQTAALVVD